MQFHQPSERRNMRGTTIGLLLVCVMLAAIAYLLSQRSSSIVVADSAVVDDGPVYDYPVSYTPSYYWIPANSYGSIYDYRRYHGPWRWHPTTYMAPPASGARYMAPYGGGYSRPPRVGHVPSMVPRAGMSHPTAPSRGGRSSWGGGGGPRH
jgi:hypothetical protein